MRTTSELVLVCVSHQHSGIGLVLLRDQTNIILYVKDSAVGFVLNGLKIQKQVIFDCTGSVRL